MGDSPQAAEGGRGRLHSQKVACAGVAARVAELRHGTGFDLADALAGEVEVLPDLFEGAGLATVEAEAQLKDLALAVVEGGEEPVDLLGQQRGGGDLEEIGRASCRERLGPYG